MTKEQLSFLGCEGDTIPAKLCLIVIDNDRKLFVDKAFREESNLKFDSANELLIFESKDGQNRIPTINYVPYDVIQSVHFRK